jgi:hypothetical protein
MIRIDERLSTADPQTLFRVAADVERWPDVAGTARENLARHGFETTHHRALWQQRQHDEIS